MRKIIYLLTTIPAIGSLVIINRVEPYVFGMPFVLFWTILWICLTSIFLIIANMLDPANKGGAE
ncbi:hypothetical protein AM501_20020 [Aneurinibacillus migulanus]|uniref:DUF3311 domain-containing protein n=1 Tax=Aneurinibacillus migulanus TaxID=47500 RepID=A0A0D1XV60_ANEMI|nr:DUF3311 domain-containing protein [Aneurinibacillus migulanus]KIV55983.1 hypothetical protein TS64_10800 [Aneurinibacillus migulanus]KIV58260.1 hypothetical protein TS65_06660 [Aneurinibacillus migulanus]KON96014.1 hypothetical protein AF333_11470 [Aneurinibacillus migulanus]KPD06502.1 hypothetical protein AM501_20020 [Aneurinibacillus migulanus]MCP1356586.1 DUF3311 domain-containing protein [Aneurinibacillus migulanus]